MFVVVGPAGKAEACSCAMLDPASMLDQSDGAFVGTLLERPTEPNSPDGFSGIFVFEVEQWVKGDMGAQVGVHSALDGAACGFEMAEGERAGVFLYNDNGRPSSGLCSVTSAEAMLGANQPLVFDGVGPPVFLIAGDTGRTRLATLDASGRLLKAVGDDRFGWSVSVCPGGDVVVDVVEGEVTVRNTNTLDPIRTLDPPADRVEQVWCLDESAERILAQAWDETGTTSNLGILGEPEPLFSGEYYLMDARTSHIALVTHPTNASVDVIEIDSGERTRISSGVDAGALFFSPGGGQLLVGETTFDSGGGYETSVTVYEVADGTVNWTSPPLPNTNIYGWLDETRLVGDFYPVDAEMPTGLIFDIDAGTTSEIGAVGWGYAPVGDSLVSVMDGRLYVTPPDGEAVALGTLPTPMHRLVAVLDDEASLTVPETTTATSTTIALEENDVTTPEAAAPDASFPTGVAAAAAGGVALILAVGWAAVVRRRRA